MSIDYNCYLVLCDTYDTNNYPMIIYKNNDIIKQIFYEKNNIFLMNNFLKIELNSTRNSQ